MSHPFGDLLLQFRARKRVLSQTRLAQMAGRILATSRRRLGILGERTWRVPTLRTASRTGSSGWRNWGRLRRSGCSSTGRRCWSQPSP
jgi:hypothetical protein